MARELASNYLRELEDIALKRNVLQLKVPSGITLTEHEGCTCVFFAALANGMAGTITGLHRSAGQLFAVAIAGSGNGRSKTPTGQLKVGFELISDRCRYAPFKKSGLSYLGSMEPR